MKLPLLICLGILSAARLSPAFTIDFDTASDFDDNFYKKVGAAGNSGLGWASDGSGGGYLQKTGSTTTGTPSNAGTIYNTNTSGGSGGTGGTTLGAPLDKFDNFTVSADFNFSILNTGQSLGFYVKTSDTGTAGYAVVIRLNDNNTLSLANADVRIFSLGNGTSGAFDGGLVTSPILNTSTFGGTNTLGLTSNTWYTFQLQVEDVVVLGVNQVQFTSMLFAQGSSTPIGNTLTFTTTTVGGGLVGLGQAGMRLNNLNNQSVKADNFSVVVVPEANPALVFGVALGGFILWRIRSRRARVG